MLTVVFDIWNDTRDSRHKLIYTNKVVKFLRIFFPLLWKLEETLFRSFSLSLSRYIINLKKHLSRVEVKVLLIPTGANALYCRAIFPRRIYDTLKMSFSEFPPILIYKGWIWIKFFNLKEMFLNFKKFHYFIKNLFFVTLMDFVSIKLLLTAIIAPE